MGEQRINITQLDEFDCELGHCIFPLLFTDSAGAPPVPGPVSLLLARHCRLCIGIEATPSSVEDARENAKINDIQNVEFINGRVEQVCVGQLSASLVALEPEDETCNVAI